MILHRYHIMLLPFLLSFFFIFYYDSYEVLLNLNSSYLTPFIYKLSTYWSSIENNVYYLLLFLLLYFVIKKNNINNNNKINIIYLLLLFILLSFIFYINSKLMYINNNLFNPLISHFLVFIHPPLILSIFVLIKIKNYNRQSNLYFFYAITITLLLGSYWATSVFGWGGWWSWDPIENISFIYWNLILLYIHKKKKLNSFFYFFYFLFDFYLFFFIKFNNFQSIHIFKIIYVNTQNLFIFVYVILLIHALLLQKMNIVSMKYSFKLILWLFFIFFTYLFIFHFYMYTYMKYIYLFYILVTLSLFYYVVLSIYNVNKNKLIYFYLVYALIILFLGLYADQLLLLLYTTYIYTINISNEIKKVKTFYLFHFLIIVSFTILYVITTHIDETHIYNMYNYINIEKNTLLCSLSGIEINLNYIDYNNKIKDTNYIFNTHNNYNIINVFEKIEFDINNNIYNNVYYYFKNNQIQIYTIRYIMELFILVSFNIIIKNNIKCARMDLNH